jgi:ATP/maltotriose-dependent transcriptional regulator MalT
MYLRTGQRLQGIELLALALHHPTTDQDTKDRAQHLLKRYTGSVEVAQHTLPATDVETVTTFLLDELETQKSNIPSRQLSQADETLIEPLSERELAVLTLIAEEHSNREIAEKLFISIATVKWYLTHIYGKLGVQNRSLAIERARELNLLTMR